MLIEYRLETYEYSQGPLNNLLGGWDIKGTYPTVGEALAEQALLHKTEWGRQGLSRIVKAQVLLKARGPNNTPVLDEEETE